MLTAVAEFTSILSNKINNVRIYKGYAEITRLISADNRQGYHTIKIDSLPSHIVHESFNIKTLREGHNGIQVLSTALLLKPTDKTTRENNEFRCLLSVLKQLRAYYLTISYSLRLKLDQHQRFLMTMGRRINTFFSPSVNGIDGDNMSIEDIEGLIVFQQNQTTAKFNEIFTIQQRLNETNSKLNMLKSIVKELRGNKKINPLPPSLCSDEYISSSLCSQLPFKPMRFSAPKTEYELQFEAFIPSKLAKDNKKLNYFELSYLVPSVNWEAQYDLYLNRNRKSRAKYELTAHLFASIRQDTREAWNNVSVEISNTKPILSIFNPTPESRSVKLEHTKLLINRKKKKIIDNFSDESFIPFNFALDRRYNIQSRELASQRILVSSSRFPVHLVTYIVPTLQQTAYLRVFGKNHPEKTTTKNAPLIQSNSARVFLGETLSGISAVGAFMPGDNFNILVGVDDNIDISTTRKRTNSKKYSETSRWFGWGKKLSTVRTEDFLFDVKSRYYNYTSNSPHKLKLILLSETLPQSVDPEIKINLLSPNPSIVYHIKAVKDIEMEEEEVLQSVLDHLHSYHVSSSFNEKVFQHGNRLVWAKLLAPGEFWRTRFKFSIEWPKKENIIMFNEYLPANDQGTIPSFFSSEALFCVPNVQLNLRRKPELCDKHGISLEDIDSNWSQMILLFSMWFCVGLLGWKLCRWTCIWSRIKSIIFFYLDCYSSGRRKF